MSARDTDLYEHDGVAWAEGQAEALRRRAAGHNVLDYDNLAEEIEDVGRSITRAARSHIDVIIEHLLKLEFVDQPENVRGWRLSVRHARRSLEDELTPTLRVRLPGELPSRLRRHVEDLLDAGVLDDSPALANRLGRGYAWEELTSVAWHPEPAKDQRLNA